VDAQAEAQVAVGCSGDVELVGEGELVFVVVADKIDPMTISWAGMTMPRNSTSLSGKTPVLAFTGGQ